MYQNVQKKSRYSESASETQSCLSPLSLALLRLNIFPLVTLFLSLSTFAQDTLRQSLSEVEVSAGRLESKQFDTPAATYFVDSSTVANTGNQVNLSDALNLAPGMVSLNRNNYAQDIQISIRGFGARTAFGLRGIRLITDDIPATTPDGQGQASTVSLTSIDHLEVLSGPLAQLYGNSSGGGYTNLHKRSR